MKIKKYAIDGNIIVCDGQVMSMEEVVKRLNVMEEIKEILAQHKHGSDS